MVLYLVSEDLYRNANSIIDELDDNMSEVKSANDFCSVFGEFSKNLSSLLKEAQSKS
jgi:DNA replication initiation complex subunit (GINS family)